MDVCSGARKDLDVADKIQRIRSGDGIDVLAAETLCVPGRSGEAVSLFVRTSAGERTIEGSETWLRLCAFQTPLGSNSIWPVLNRAAAATSKSTARLE
jgi:hypothetical protein